MSLEYLSVPVIFFVVLMLIFIPLFRSDKVFGNRTVKKKIGLEELSRVCSVLQTAKLGDRCAEFWVPRSKSRLSVTFDAGGLNLRCPLNTKVLRGKEEQFVEGLRSLDIEASVERENTPIVTGRAAGTPETVADQFVAVYLLLNEAEVGDSVMAEVSTWETDLLGLGLFKMPGQRSGYFKGGYPVSTTAKANLDRIPEARVMSGCIAPASRVLLKPIPFVLAYFWYGIVMACWVALAVSVLGLIVRIVSGRRYSSWRSKANVAAFFAPYLAVLGSGSAFFLQILPTLFCVWLGGSTIVEVMRGKYSFEAADMDYGDVGRTLMAAGIVGASIIGIAANEYVRATQSLDTWIWYFSYFRLEFMLGGLLLWLPGGIVGIKHAIAQEDADKIT